MKPIPIDVIAAFIAAKDANTNDKIVLNLINKENVNEAKLIISGQNKSLSIYQSFYKKPFLLLQSNACHTF